MRNRRIFIAVLTVSLGVAASAGGQGSSPPSVEEVMSRLGYSEADRQALRAGKIVTTDLKRTRDDQLIAAAAMYLPEEISSLRQRVDEGRYLQNDPGIFAMGALAQISDLVAWQSVGFDASEDSEAKRLLGYRAGDAFNLSKDEVEALRLRFKGLRDDSPDLPEKVSAGYRDVLMGRHAAYVKEGLKGIVPYDQGRQRLNPAKELATVAEQTKGFLSTFFPDFDKAFTGFPKTKVAGIASRHYWLKRNVEGRPAFVLAHQMVAGGEDYILLSLREYFVGHTYDSQQVVALALPLGEGTAVFYLNSAFTEKITGFFSGVAQSVGQDRMKSELTDYFKTVRKKQGL